MKYYTKPNLFIIGAMKSGTTYLHELLSTHPQIFMSLVKEPCYFVHPKELKRRWPEMWKNMYWKSEENYLKLFNGPDNTPIVGESSAEYTNYPLLSGIPERIQRFNPDSRFIYILRDPIERTISHYWMYINYYALEIDPSEAIRKRPELIAISNYTMQLKQFLQFFNIDKIFVTTFEELTSNPKNSYQQILAWLNVDNTYIPDNLNTPKNVSSYKIRKQSALGLLFKFQNSKVWDKIGGFFPSWFTSFGSRLAVSYYDKNQTPMEDFKEMLRPIYLPQVDELSNILNRDFSIWKTLFNS